MPNMQRDADSVWASDGPITNLEEALKALNTSGGAHMLPPYLAVRETDGGRIWEIVRNFRERGVGGVEYFQVDPFLAEKLTREGFVVQDEGKVWGNTLPRGAGVLSDSAIEACCVIYRNLADAAEHFTRAFAGLNEEALMG